MATRQKTSRRQNIRRTILAISLLLMPVVINYYSPYLIVDGSLNGIVVGSFVFFTLLFLTSLVFGRAYCGWLCPFSGYMECLAYANDKRTNSRLGHIIKWTIWVIWIGVIVYAAMSAGGYAQIDVLYNTDNIISVDEPSRYYFLYFPVLGLAILFSLTLGKRAWCHYVCWAGNFAAIGTKIKNTFKWPSLHLEADKENCINCKSCNTVCSKSLDVNKMVQSGLFDNPECILCGNCVDNCPQGNIRYAFRWHLGNP